MIKRKYKFNSKTGETNIAVSINLDGKGKYKIDTGIGFFNHLLESLSLNSLIDLKIKARGDLWVDEHHTVEDVALALGQALRQALGNKCGIERFGFVAPMDESLAEAVIDLGGRPYLVWNAVFKREKIGDLPTELIEHFFYSLAVALGANIHIKLRYGKNEHHMAEAIIKAFARALRQAVKLNYRILNKIPSTKKTL